MASQFRLQNRLLFILRKCKNPWNSCFSWIRWTRLKHIISYYPQSTYLITQTAHLAHTVTQTLTCVDHKHCVNGKKGWMCFFSETDRGWSLKTQMPLITTCHNSGFSFKSCVSLHQSLWSPAHLTSASKIHSPLSVCLSGGVFKAASSWLPHPGMQGVVAPLVSVFCRGAVCVFSSTGVHF